MATVVPPLTLLTEAVQSVVILSDLFYEETQFEWMLMKLNDIQRHHPIEDDIMHAILRVGICKAIAVLGNADSTLIDHTKRFIETSLKNGSISNQTSCIQSLLYLLQSKKNQKQGPGPSSIAQNFLPLTIDYLRTSLISSAFLDKNESPNLVSETYLSTLWSLAFFVIEDESNFANNNSITYSSMYKDVIQLAINATRNSIASSSSHGIYFTLVSGLQRLVVCDYSLRPHVYDHKIEEDEQNTFKYCRKQILRLATDLLTESNPVVIVPAVQLFLSCIYSDVAINRKKSITTTLNQNENKEDRTTDSPKFELGDDPELLMQTMEQISIIFDCVRRSDSTVAELLCYDVLPSILLDFFPASDVINRVINEFISPGQPHQVLLAWVLFDVFKHGAQQDQTSMLQEWVLMALPNFTKRSPISHSIWCLTVFFISASATNPWLQSMFPYLQQRYGYYQNEDKKLFCVAAKYFYNNLDHELHKQKFIDTFELVSHPQTPYYDLLKSL